MFGVQNSLPGLPMEEQERRFQREVHIGKPSCSLPRSYSLTLPLRMFLVLSLKIFSFF